MEDYTNMIEFIECNIHYIIGGIFSLICSIFCNEYVFVITKTLGLILVIISGIILMNNFVKKINENIKNGEDLLEDINKVILKILKNYDYSDNFTTKNNILRSAVKIRGKFYKNLYYTLIPLGVGGVLINTMQDAQTQTIVLLSMLIIIGAILCGKMCKYMYIDFLLREVLKSESHK